MRPLRLIQAEQQLSEIDRLEPWHLSSIENVLARAVVVVSESPMPMTAAAARTES
jgi:hypothetical protein